MTLPLERTRVESWDEAAVSLRVYGKRKAVPYIARKLVVTHEGDIPMEIYYTPEEQVSVVIHRSEFKEIESELGFGKKGVVFPHKILIEGRRRDTTGLPLETLLHFHDIFFPVSMGEEELTFSIPPETQVVRL